MRWPRSSQRVAPSSPVPSALPQLISHLQRAFQRLDRAGDGICQTVQLLRALQITLASQAAIPRARRGWVQGLSYVCNDLENRLTAARQGEDTVNELVENLTVAWEDVLAVAKEAPDTLAM